MAGVGDPAAGARRGWGAWLAVAGGVGALLRLWNLRAQVVSDDEVHTVEAVLASPVAELLTSYSRLDYSLPMAALYRALADAGVELTELVLRSVPLAAGLALLVVVPLGAVRLLGQRPAVWLAGLLAVSTPLVLYSRIVRPYSWAALLAVVALAAFVRWWPEGPWRWGGLYVAAAALGVWFLPVAAPFVGAPLLWAAGDLVASRGRLAGRGGWLRLGGLAAGLAVAVAATWLPAAGPFLEVLGRKSGRVAPELGSWAGALQLHAGTGSAPVAAALGLLAVVGLVRWVRRDRRPALYWAAPVVLQAAAVQAAAPLGSHDPLVLERYLLPTLPVVLAWAAFALGTPWGRGRLAAAARPAAGVTLIATLLATGPFADPAFRASPFMQAKDYLAVQRPAPRLPPGAVPGFYRAVLPTLPPGPVVEHPWLPVWHYTQALHLYQEVHGRDVVVAPPAGRLDDPRLGWRNLAPPQPEELLASGGRYLVVHLDYAAEEERVVEAGRAYPGIRLHLARQLRSQGPATAAALEARWGPADWSGPGLEVWDLERVRGRGAGPVEP